MITKAWFQPVGCFPGFYQHKDMTERVKVPDSRSTKRLQRGKKTQTWNHEAEGLDTREGHFRKNIYCIIEMNQSDQLV